MGAGKQAKHHTSVRIIGGRLRGRRIPVRAEGIRPTGDRVRETLFNWLAAKIHGARCLDMFAGTGALGLEALSRGAAAVSFVEKNRRAAGQIEDLASEFGCANARCITADATKLDYSNYGPFDVVFVDPPFDGPDQADLCTLLEESGALAEPALVYIEAPARRGLPELPDNWTMLREGKAGQVCYGLAERSALRRR